MSNKPQLDKHSVFICEFCGSEFEDYTYRKPRFCSRKCGNTYRARLPRPTTRKPEIHITQPCKICGKNYVSTIYQIKLRGGSCCSKECANQSRSQSKMGIRNPNYRGGKVTSRGRNWGIQSRKALKRDGYCCQICHKRIGIKKSDYGIHHIKPYREFDNDYVAANQLSNLITLCRRCHARVESGKLACPRPLI